MKLKRFSLFLRPLAALALCSSAEAAITWTTGTSADASGAWNGGPPTFNGQTYTTADDLNINGTAAKTITTSGTVTTPNSLTVSSTGATTLTGTSVGGALSKTSAGVLTLATPNAFGQVSISGGKFIVNDPAGLGTTGTLNVNSGTVGGVTGSYTAPGATFFYDAATLSSSYTLPKAITFGTVAANTTYGMAMQTGSSAAPLTTTLGGNVTAAANVTIWLDVRATAAPNFSTWILTGDNSAFAGNIRLNRGNIQFNALNSMGTGALFIQTNGSDGFTASGGVIPPSSLTFGFEGTVPNAITMRAGSASAVSINTGANNVTLSGTLVLSGDAAGDTSSNFVKNGTGTLALTGTVDTLLRANGTVTATSPLTQGALTSGNVSANVRGGMLDVSGMSGTTLTFNALNGAAGATLNLGAKALVASSGTFAGTLSGTSASLTKNSTGTLSLTGLANAFTGGATVNTGTLSIAAAGSIGSGAITGNSSYGTAYATAGAPFLLVNNTTATVLPNAIVIPSPATTQFYALQKTAGSAGTLELSGSISGGNATSTLQLDTPTAGDSTTGFILSGTGNTLAGTLRLNRGYLTLTNAGSVGTAAVFLQSNPNAAGNLRFSDSFTLPNDITFGTTSNNAISTSVNDVTLSGTVTSTSAVSWSKAGSGSLTLGNKTNAMTSAIVVTDGTLAIGGSGLLNSGAYAGGITLAAATSILNYGSSAVQTMSGIISGAGGVTMSGSGALTLSGVNTYTGTTTVTGGTLVLTQACLGDGADVSINTGGVLELDTAATDNVRALYLDGVSQVTGEWGGMTSGAANTTPLITGAGKLMVTGAVFSSWAGSHGLTGADAAFNADPDHDGITNGIEYVLGGEPNPAKAGSNSIALLPVVDTSGSSVVVTYNRTDESAYLNPVIQFSTDLVNWTTAVDGVNSTIITIDGTPSDTVTVIIPKGSNASLFTRLFVTQ